MRTIFLLLSLLLAIPSHASSDQFDSFLPKFRVLYDKYHFGKHLPQKEVDWIAAEIWIGSGKNWLFATTTACQCICETHWEINNKKTGPYLGHIGMKRWTIFVEDVRLGICKNNSKARHKLYAYCLKYPCYADY